MNPKLGLLSFAGLGHLAISTLPTSPFPGGQKPGTSGLRAKTATFMQPNYLSNFLHSIFASLPPGVVRGGTLVIGGDGRYFSPEALQLTAKVALGAGVNELWIGKDGLLSTPAISAIIREKEATMPGYTRKAFGAVILTASHNPAGPDGDFGVKFNGENGAPAPAHVTDAIALHTQALTFTRQAKDYPAIDTSKVGPHYHVSPDGSRSIAIHIIDPADDYVALLKKVFDFKSLKKFFAAHEDFSMAYDSMWAVQGPYAERILQKELGLPKHRLSLLQPVPLPDFGGGHADPNLAHAKKLMALMGVDSDGMTVPKTDDDAPRPTLGAAADGDGDRNMILGDGVFVTPSDSLAVLSAHVGVAVPWFKSKGGLRAIARSMPTSRAADVVAEELGIPLFEVPTGWKYFGNLMDTPKYTPLICGEESFGTSSDHVREKDGMWATLAWVSLLAERNRAVGAHARQVSAPLVGVAQVMQEHWEKHGRHYYLRYDYEGLEGLGAKALMDELSEKVSDAAGGWAGLQPVATAHGLEIVEGSGVFSYDDPVDGSHAASQGVRIVLRETNRSGEQETLRLAGDRVPWNARVVFRLSGTGVGGATLRMYIERYAAPAGESLGLNENPKQSLATLAAAVRGRERSAHRNLILILHGDLWQMACLSHQNRWIS